MISPDHVRLMARYNAWQNGSIYAAADTLSETERNKLCGAFFGSIHATLSHLVWADRLWMHRLAGWPAPREASIARSVSEHTDWRELTTARAVLDTALVDWTQTVDADWLEGDLAWYSGAQQRHLVERRWVVLTHVFNHQTHHRGQVHCLLTQAGARPGDTDLPFMPR